LISLSIFHTPDNWTFRAGLVLGEIGFYFLCRIFIRDLDDARRTVRSLCFVIVPLAILMTLEKQLGVNVFSVMGGSGLINIREGRVRAYGPFGHSILAGTVGAICVPLTLGILKHHRVSALVGTSAAMAIVLASTSSGPVLAMGSCIFALLVWYVRERTRLLVWGACVGLVLLQLVMHDPVYFVVARIDITGGSTGWHRAQLIREAQNHFSEWWAVGTDFTRHWMPTGIHANETQTDITNHFLQMGVWGGLPLLSLFIMILRSAFRIVSAQFRSREVDDLETAYLIWSLGSALFGLIVTFWSISLFDQSASMLYLVLAMIASAIPMRDSTVVAAVSVRSGRPAGVASPTARHPRHVSVGLRLSPKFHQVAQR
jgi:hypothetical protein